MATLNSNTNKLQALIEKANALPTQLDTSDADATGYELVIHSAHDL